MTVITLTSDLSRQDHYSGAIEGQILSNLPEAEVVEISHHIEPFNIVQGAFVLRNCYADFPEGTIHLISVDASYGGNRGEAVRYLLVQHEQHYFIGTDNGFFSLLFDESPEQIYTLSISDNDLPSFPLKSIFVPAALKLGQGQAPEDIGAPTDSMVEKRSLQPIVRDDFLQGSIIYIDAYKNAMVNIHQALFEEVGGARPYRIYYARKDYTEQIVQNYNEVPEGEVLCLFGDSGYLEIAINKDKASELLGLEIGDPVQIEFL
jgi:S-adenosylmethionine hydrolase